MIMSELLKIGKENKSFLSKEGAHTKCLIKPDIPVFQNNDLNCYPAIIKDEYQCDVKKKREDDDGGSAI